MGRASTFEKKIKNFKNLAGLPIFEIFDFFLPKFQSFTKNDPESSIFIAFTSSLFQNVCNFYRYATIYFFLKKYRVKRGEGGQNGGKKPHFGKKNKKTFFWLSFLSQNYFYCFF